MNTPKLLQRILPGVIAVLLAHAGMAQVRVEGTVYDGSQRYALQGVSVMSASGGGTTTDSSGHYSIKLALTDSIYFSYLGKVTSKIPVKHIDDPTQFNMSLDVPVQALPSVFVDPKSYRMDSLENRREYQKIFDFDRAGFLQNKKANGDPTFGIGLDMDVLFDGKRNKRMEGFQQFLVQEEQEKSIDHRFTRALVKRLTGLEPPALDTFMHRYRPSYEFCQATTSDWEFYEYIRDSGKYFTEIWRQEQHN